MEPSQPNKLPTVDVQAKFFEVAVPVREGYQSNLPNQMNINFELDVPRAKYEQLCKESENLPPKSNKGKHLMIFGDQSGSMSGKPFDVLKAGCLDVARHLFNDDGDLSTQPFEKVHMIFYASKIEREVVTDDKKEYIDKIHEKFNWGGTYFRPCFERILETVKEIEDNAEIDIIFLTDGCGESLSSSGFKNFCEKFKTDLKEAKRENNISTTMYALGFS